MTTEQTIQEKLSAPFSVTHQKKGMTYITGEQVTSRLNDVLGWDGWDFQVKMHGYDQESDEIWVLGELTVRTTAGVVVKEQFGSQKHNRTKDAKEIIDYGFDLKGAATDAMKKCASLVGVGLYLSERDGGTPAAQPMPQRPPVQNTPAKPRATFMELAAQMGYTREQVDQCSQLIFENRVAKDLTGTERTKLLAYMETAKREAMKEKVSA